MASMSVSRRQSRASRLFLDEQSGKSSVREATAGEVSNCPEFPSYHHGVADSLAKSGSQRWF